MAGIAKDSTAGRGKYDDGGLGSHLVRLDQAGLVAVPARSFQGALSDGIGVSTGTTQGVSNYGGTGVPTKVSLTTKSQANETLQSLAVWRVRFYGRRIGLWVYTYNNTDPVLTAFVNKELKFSGHLGGVRFDGVPVPSARGLLDGHSLLPIAQDLPDDGPHTLTVAMAADQSVDSLVDIAALLLEERVGYRSIDRVLLQQPTLTLTTSYQTAPISRNAAFAVLDFVNTDATAHTVSVQVGSDVFTIPVPASSTAQWAPAAGTPVVFQSTVSVKADAATVVKCLSMTEN